MTRFEDLIDQKFGELTVIAFGGQRGKNGNTAWICECSCGEITVVLAGNLKRGHTKTCGHGSSRNDIGEKRLKHGFYRTRIYRIWQEMKRRCYNPNGKSYKYYGLKGIIVDPDWLGPDGFEHFLRDMGECPEGMSIHRIDNYGPYTKENCKWADDVEQARNKGNGKFLVLNGESHCASEWAEIKGWSRETIKSRYLRGWTDEEILTTPPGQKRRNNG